jgi:thiol-disulfide isomerase/thioredoxin
MQKYSFLLLAVIIIYLSACGTQKGATASNNTPKDVTVQLTIKDTAAPDTLRLFAWHSIQVDEVMPAAATISNDAKTYTFQLGENVPKGMYYLGESLADLKPILLGTEAMVKLKGSSAKASEFEIVDSKLNKEYEALLVKIQSDNQYFMTLLGDFAKNKDNEEELNKLRKKMEIEDKVKKDRLDSLVAAKSELARIMALNTFQSYQNNGVPGQTEGTYFANTFFQFVDFKDTTYANLPFYYENIKNYAMALTQMGLQNAQQQAFIDSILVQIPDSSKNYKPTVVGAMLGTMSRNNALFLRYADIYTKKFKGEYEMLDKFVMEQTIKLKGAAGEGTLAPDLKAPNPEGIEKSLSEMRGKYVLIDFWASWCGPCRRENPNVVRLYNKYKDKGFDILGVSLDNNKKRWVDAIAKDQLTWTHISDLKGWSSMLAKPYGVRGIPYTVLVDKEGRIIAKRLRGASLEAKLKQLFGE